MTPVDEFTTLQAIVDQLRSCEFTCEAGRLESNVAFMALERRAKIENFLLGKVDSSCKFEIHEVTGACKTLDPETML